MSDGTLSQDEIDALLQSSDDLMTESLGETSTSGGGFSGGGSSVSGESLSEPDKAALGELIREVGMAQASAINTLTGISTKFTAPFIESGQLDSLKKNIKGKVIQAKINLTGGVSGEWTFVVPERSVLTVTNILIGQEDNTELSDLVVSTFGEVISQTTGAMVVVLTDKLGRPTTPGVPHLDLLQDPSALTVSGGAFVVRLDYNFTMEGKGNIKFFVFIPISVARAVVSAFNANKMSQTASFGSGVQPIQQQGGVAVQQVGFEALQHGVESEGQGSISLLLDVPMRVTVELGRTRMTIKEILALGEGSIIELDKLAGEPVDILVNDKRIASGEVVVIDENFAVRVTKILTSMERLSDSMTS